MPAKTEEKNNNAFPERSRMILGAIVKDYILTAEPVGSKAVATRYPLDLSPATIRNIMAELENDGFLTQPHTSAGRIPTEKSFRFYIDSLLEPEEPPEYDKRTLKECSEAASDIEGVLERTTKTLSTLTSCAGLVFIPRSGNFTIRHIKLLPIDPDAVMVIIVSRLGMVKTRRVRLDAALAGLNFEKVSNYLNSIGSGLTLRALRAKIAREMKKEKNLYDELLTKAFRLGCMALYEDDTQGGKDIYVEGKAKMLEQPEFKDNFERLKGIFAAFEEKSLLIKILDKSIEDSGVSVFMGSQSNVREFSGLSFVTAPCGGDAIGSLGVIGPVRMNYSKILPLVSYTAGLLSERI